MATLINLHSFKKFFQFSSTGGIILIICVIVSLIIANSGAGPGFEALLATQIGADMDAHYWRGMLGGIGFTMSIFIALLSFSGKELILSEAKFSILTASVISGLLGYFWLHQVEKRTRKKTQST